MEIHEIAKQLYDTQENIILVYAFNGTGKTRLSVGYKDYTKSQNDNKHIGVYYNAFSEDLFVWNNDEENNNENIALKIVKSTLNEYYQLLNEIEIRRKLEPFNPKYDFFFNPSENPEDVIESISFFVKGDETTPIKISRGEERIFVWCFFLALFEVEGWADLQAKHFFIDDPVSSLDDDNIFVTALTIFNLMEREVDRRKIIFTTHHIGIATLLSDWLSKGEHKDKFVNRNKSKKFKQFILENKKGVLELSNPRNSVLLYHLRLIQILDEAKTKDELYIYHFALLRQVLENVSSFLGVGQFNYVLREIGITDPNRISNIINALSHQKVYYNQNELLVPDNKEIFLDILEKLQTKYNFVLHN